MKKLTQEQLADMATIVNKTTRDMVKQILHETGGATENDERTIAIASMCAAQAVTYALAYLYEIEENGAPNFGAGGSSQLQ